VILKVVLDHVKKEAENISTFYFRPGKPVHFTAGQYAEWTIKHPHPDERGIKHWFTISSSPTEELVSLTTKYAGEKSSTFKQALFNLQPGDEIEMSEPMGDFVLPKLIQTPLLFVAGGIGLTPFHSIFEWLATTGEQRDIKFLYGVRNEDEIVFQDTFDKVGIQPTVVVSEPSPAWGGERGRITAEMILGLGQPTEDTLIYVSGPEPMVESLEADLKKAGHGKQFVGDYFPNYDKAY
jgi:glycine betaine catabolism B